MPVRSLNSSILKWPDAHRVEQFVRDWSNSVVRKRADIVRIGYFGSYARGDWGVGSDLDLVIVVENSEKSFERRATEWDLTKFPVPTDLIVYTCNEWRNLKKQTKFFQMLMKEAIWLFVKE